MTRRGALAMCLVVGALAACARDDAAPPAGTPAALAAYLRTVVGAGAGARAQAVAGWKLDAATWRRVVVPPYRDAYADYAAAFDTASAAIVAQLATPGEIRARRHFADDPSATGAQVRLRWALPVLYPSAVATIGGAPIDTVFVPDPAGGAHWRALLGLPEVMLARTAAADPACAALLARAGPPGACTEVGWMVADAAMRGDREALGRACALAAARCR